MKYENVLFLNIAIMFRNEIRETYVSVLLAFL